MSLSDSLLRVIVTAIHRLARVGWFFSRPRTLGAHAYALSPEGKLILVKLRYAKGWRLPGGGCKPSEPPSESALRELREEIGMTSHGAVRLVRQFKQKVHGKQDLATLFIVEGICYQPRWSLEVEEVGQFGLENLPSDLAPVTRAWIEAVQNS